jgi:predicted nucleic acid-binding protein
MFVLDTNLVSELRKVRFGKADAQVAKWANSINAASLYVSAITIMELEIGVLQIQRRDPAQGAMLCAWMDRRVLPEITGRVLPVDAAVAQCCARLNVPDPYAQRDALIVATALVHGMTVVARNLADFQPSGVALLNLWDA